MQAARARTVVYSSLQAPATSAARRSVGASKGEQASTCRARASISSRSTSYGKATRAQLGGAVWTGQQEAESVVSLHYSPASQRSPGSAPPLAAPATPPWQLRPGRWEAAGRRWRQGGLSPWAAVCTPSPVALPGQRSGQPQRPASPDTREGTAEERPPVHVIRRTLRAFALRVALTPHLSLGAQPPAHWDVPPGLSRCAPPPRGAPRPHGPSPAGLLLGTPFPGAQPPWRSPSSSSMSPAWRTPACPSGRQPNKLGTTPGRGATLGFVLKTGSLHPRGPPCRPTSSPGSSTSCPPTPGQQQPARAPPGGQLPSGRPAYGGPWTWLPAPTQPGPASTTRAWLLCLHWRLPGPAAGV